MRIHENIEAECLCFPEYSNGMRYPFLVVSSRPGMLYRLPSKDVSYGVVAPAAKPGKVRGGILYRKGPVHERDVVAVEKTVGDV
jgi:hypothetical protein